MAFVSKLCPATEVCSLSSKLIAWVCCSLWVWLCILLVQMESAPNNHLLLKFLLCKMLDRNFKLTVHFSFLTTLALSSMLLSQSSHVMVLHSSLSLFKYHISYLPFFSAGVEVFLVLFMMNSTLFWIVRKKCHNWKLLLAHAMYVITHVHICIASTMKRFSEPVHLWTVYGDHQLFNSYYNKLSRYVTKL